MGTKFQLRLTILIFWTKFAGKGCFRSKTEKSNLCVCTWLFLTILNFLLRGSTDATVFVARQEKGAY